MHFSAHVAGANSASLRDAAWRKEFAFESHWFATSDGRLHYIDQRPSAHPAPNPDAPCATPNESDAPLLLFVHGNPTWSFHWRRLITAFAPEVRCIAVDHLGCGLSDLAPRPLTLADRIEHLRQLVESLDLRRATLVAQDWGGSIGLGTMLEAPHRFERIVLFNTGAFPPWSIPWRIRICRWPLAGRLALQGAGLFSRAALHMTLARSKRLAPAVAAGYLAPYNTWRRRAAVYQFVRDIPSDSAHPTWKTLQQIDDRLPRLAHVPSLLIWGERDWCFTTECLDRFVAAWPDAQVERLPDVGHWVVEDAPDDALDLMRRFVVGGAAGANHATTRQSAYRPAKESRPIAP